MDVEKDLDDLDNLDPDEALIALPPFRPVEVPRDLHSDYLDGPFRTCTACARPLAECDLYEVQKVLRGRECVFELAMCHACGEALAQEFSEESLTEMKGFLLCRFKPSIESEHCNFCSTPRHLFANYTLLGVCRSTEERASLIFPRIVMCDSCSEQLQQRLSKKTRDVQGDFVRDSFPGVPADLDLSPISGCF